MAELLDKYTFEIDINRYNPNGFCLIHVDLDEKEEPVDWTFIYANEALAELEGTTIEELTGHRFFDIFPDGDRKWLKPYYAAAYENKIIRVDDISKEIGHYLHVDVYPTGKKGYCTCVLQDISKEVFERSKQREHLEAVLNELEKERQLNSKVKEYAQAMGVMYPLAISMDYKNDSYHMIEYDNFLNKTAESSGSIDDLISVGASTIPDYDLAKQFWKLFNREASIKAFKSGKKEIVLRHSQNGDDGKVHYMDTRAICIECSEDRIEGISLSRCIDEEAERNLALAKEAKHAEIINALSTIYTTIMEADLTNHGYRVIKSLDLMKTATNDADEGDFDAVKETVLEYFMAPEHRDYMRVFLDLGTLSERLKNTNTVLTEYKNLDGKWLEARFIANKRDDEGNVISAIYVARDITREKEVELHYREELRAAAIEADKANVSKTNFLRRMSHDIRTPLNGIIGMLHIAERYQDDPEKFGECMDKVNHSAAYLLDLVNNVLDISKLESGTIELEHKPFDLGELLLSTIPIISTNAGENGIEFRGGRDDTHITHRYVYGSPVHLKRVLMNVASNAVKYNRQGGYVKIYCNELQSDDNNASFEFVCEDSGLGMSEDFQKRAFEPFSQEGKETTTSFSGTGLGLSIVKDIVTLMGGTVELNSKENVGTTIRMLISFPIDHDPVISEPAEAEANDAEANVSGLKVLVVEDNELNLEIAKIMLEDNGLIAESAANGKEAVEMFEASEPDTFAMIFMDMMMPVMDGLDAARAIRALPRPDAKSVPIIAMTANAFNEDRQACIEAGMNDHIGKPIDAKILNTVIMKYAVRNAV